MKPLKLGIVLCVSLTFGCASAWGLGKPRKCPDKLPAVVRCLPFHLGQKLICLESDGETVFEIDFSDPRIDDQI